VSVLHDGGRYRRPGAAAHHRSRSACPDSPVQRRGQLRV